MRFVYKRCLSDALTYAIAQKNVGFGKTDIKRGVLVNSYLSIASKHPETSSLQTLLQDLMVISLLF